MPDRILDLTGWGRPPAEEAPARHLIVGLGNPGPRYARHRHNVGFQCLNRLAETAGLSFNRTRFKALLTEGELAGRRVVLAKPLTYMNLSGQAVGPLVHWYKVPLEHLLVIYDDLDLPQGRIRLRPQGGAGGHKGLLSIIEQLGSHEFARLRVGIGRPVGGEATDYVLSVFAAEEAITMSLVYDRVVAAVQRWLQDGLVAAMNEFN